MVLAVVTPFRSVFCVLFSWFTTKGHTKLSYSAWSHPASSSSIFTARCYTERDYATVCRLSVHPSAQSVCLSVCDVQVRPWSHRLEYFENNFMADERFCSGRPQRMGDLVQWEHPEKKGGIRVGCRKPAIISKTEQDKTKVTIYMTD